MEKTKKQFDIIIEKCRNVFTDKQKDYGTVWRILREPSIADQIYIKAGRIRSIQEKGEQKIEDDIVTDFIGIVNYSVMAIIQLEKGVADEPDMTGEEALKLYDHYIYEARDLMLNKNHDYGEAWRVMRVSSITDIILMKLFRIKHIEDNQGKTIVSEGLKSNYQDIINYSIFALIKLLLENEK